MQAVREAGNTGHDFYWFAQMYQDEWVPENHGTEATPSTFHREYHQ